MTKLTLSIYSDWIIYISILIMIILESFFAFYRYYTTVTSSKYFYSPRITSVLQRFLIYVIILLILFTTQTQLYYWTFPIVFLYYFISNIYWIYKYIILIISHGDNDIKQIFKALNHAKMLKYPYFYIATDGWFDAKVIQNITNDFTNFQGIIGCLPWQPMTLNNSYYKQYNLSDLHTNANELYNEIEEYYYLKYGNNSQINLETETTELTPMGSRLIYAYDSTILYAKILQKLYGKYGGLNSLFEDNDPQQIIKFITEIVLNEIEFESVTGRVTLNENGDRDNGLYSFGYITEYGDIDYFGYSFFQTINDSNGTVFEEFKVIINEELIIWPITFSNRNIIPQSHSATVYELSLISSELFIVMTVISSIAIGSMLIYIGHIFWRYLCVDLLILPKLNLVIYIGVIIAYINVIISGLDERLYPDDIETLNTLCNVRVWFVVISFTLCFTPMFAKTYKLSKIFTELMITKTIRNKVLLLRVGIALLIDLILLIIFVSLEPFLSCAFIVRLVHFQIVYFVLCILGLFRAVCTIK